MTYTLTTQGDIGGPVYLWREGVFYQVGLTTGSSPNATQIYNFFERVSTHCTFIQRATYGTVPCVNDKEL